MDPERLAGWPAQRAGGTAAALLFSAYHVSPRTTAKQRNTLSQPVMPPFVSGPQDEGNGLARTWEELAVRECKEKLCERVKSVH